MDTEFYGIVFILNTSVLHKFCTTIIFWTTQMGVGAHVGLTEEVVDAIDRGALVTPSLAANTFAIQTTPTLTAGGQFKRCVVGSRSKRGIVLGTASRQLLVAQSASAAAVVVVVASVERLRKTSLFLFTTAVVVLVVVGGVVVGVVATLVVL